MDIDPDQHVGQALPGRPQTLQSLAVTMPGAEDAAPEDAKDSALDFRCCQMFRTKNAFPNLFARALSCREEAEQAEASQKILASPAVCGPVVERQEPATDVWLSLAASVSELGSYLPGRECFLKRKVMAELAVNAMLRLKGKWARRSALHRDAEQKGVKIGH